jgi:hypothetical protein
MLPASVEASEKLKFVNCAEPKAGTSVKGAINPAPQGPMTYEGPLSRSGMEEPVDGASEDYCVLAHPKLSSVGELDWDALFPDDPESFALYQAFERAAPPNFLLGALTCYRSARLVACAPLFKTRYRLDTPFQGRWRHISDRLHARLPNLLNVPVLGIGSPLSDNCSIGFAEGMAPVDQRAALSSLLKHLRAAATKEKSLLVAAKSVGPDAELFDDVFRAHGFHRVTSVPVVMLSLPYCSFDQYLSSLPLKTASYMRRKLRPAASLKIEYRSSVGELENQLHELHRATLEQSGVDYGDFDRLHPRYFSSVLEALGERARLMLCWRDDELLSFQLFLVSSRKIIANKIGMKYPIARDYNLYFVNWLRMIEFAIERRIPEIEMGATAYTAKLLFGGRIERRWLYFRFTSPLMDRVFKPLHWFFDFERNDPELKRLRNPHPPHTIEKR